MATQEDENLEDSYFGNKAEKSKEIEVGDVSGQGSEKKVPIDTEADKLKVEELQEKIRVAEEKVTRLKEKAEQTTFLNDKALYVTKRETQIVAEKYDAARSERDLAKLQKDLATTQREIEEKNAGVYGKNLTRRKSLRSFKFRNEGLDPKKNVLNNTTDNKISFSQELAEGSSSALQQVQRQEQEATTKLKDAEKAFSKTIISKKKEERKNNPLRQFDLFPKRLSEVVKKYIKSPQVSQKLNPIAIDEATVTQGPPQNQRSEDLPQPPLKVQANATPSRSDSLPPPPPSSVVSPDDIGASLVTEPGIATPPPPAAAANNVVNSINIASTPSIPSGPDLSPPPQQKEAKSPVTADSLGLFDSAEPVKSANSKKEQPEESQIAGLTRSEVEKLPGAEVGQEVHSPLHSKQTEQPEKFQEEKNPLVDLRTEKRPGVKSIDQVQPVELMDFRENQEEKNPLLDLRTENRPGVKSIDQVPAVELMDFRENQEEKMPLLDLREENRPGVKNIDQVQPVELMDLRKLNNRDQLILNKTDSAQGIKPISENTTLSQKKPEDLFVFNNQITIIEWKTVGIDKKEFKLQLSKDGPVHTITSLQPDINKPRKLILPEKMEGGGPVEFAFAAFDENGQRVSEANRIDLKVEYNEKGELAKFGVSPDYPLISGRDEDFAMVLGKDGKKYALGMSNKEYSQMKEKALNKGLEKAADEISTKFDNIPSRTPSDGLANSQKVQTRSEAVASPSSAIATTTQAPPQQKEAKSPVTADSLDLFDSAQPIKSVNLGEEQPEKSQIAGLTKSNIDRKGYTLLEDSDPTSSSVMAANNTIKNNKPRSIKDAVKILFSEPQQVENTEVKKLSGLEVAQEVHSPLHSKQTEQLEKFQEEKMPLLDLREENRPGVKSIDQVPAVELMDFRENQEKKMPLLDLREENRPGVESTGQASVVPELTDSGKQKEFLDTVTYNNKPQEIVWTVKDANKQFIYGPSESLKETTVTLIQPEGQKHIEIKVEKEIAGGPVTLSFPAFDENGKRVPEANRIDLKVEYNEHGKITKYGPSIADLKIIEGKDADPLTVERDGKKYILGTTNKEYREMQQQIECTLGGKVIMKNLNIHSIDTVTEISSTPYLNRSNDKAQEAAQQHTKSFVQRSDNNKRGIG